MYRGWGGVKKIFYYKYLVSNAIIKPKNLNLNNGNFNIKCHFEVNRLQSIGKYIRSEGPGYVCIEDREVSRRFSITNI